MTYEELLSKVQSLLISQIEHNEFVAHVAAMRKAQRIYFDLRKRHIDAKQQLEASKALESRVDAIIGKEEQSKAALQQLLFQ